MFDISSASIHGLMPLKLHEVTFAGYQAFSRFFDPYLKFCDIFGVSWQNMASDEGEWFITPLFKLNSVFFKLCITSFCSEI